MMLETFKKTYPRLSLYEVASQQFSLPCSCYRAGTAIQTFVSLCTIFGR